MVTLFGTKYDDEALVREAERALGQVPAIDPATLTVGSNKGVVVLTGYARSTLGKRHAAEAVRKAFQHKNLKYKEIVDQISGD